MKRILWIKGRNTSHSGEGRSLFFSADTDLELGEAALALLVSRFDQPDGDQQYYHQVLPPPPDFPEDSIDTLPTPFKLTAEGMWENYRDQVRNVEKWNELYDLTEMVVKERNKLAAFDILKRWNRHEPWNSEKITLCEISTGVYWLGNVPVGIAT